MGQCGSNDSSMVPREVNKNRTDCNRTEIHPKKRQKKNSYDRTLTKEKLQLMDEYGSGYSPMNFFCGDHKYSSEDTTTLYSTSEDTNVSDTSSMYSIESYSNNTTDVDDDVAFKEVPKKRLFLVERIKVKASVQKFSSTAPLLEDDVISAYRGNVLRLL